MRHLADSCRPRPALLSATGLNGGKKAPGRGKIQGEKEEREGTRKGGKRLRERAERAKGKKAKGGAERCGAGRAGLLKVLLFTNSFFPQTIDFIRSFVYNKAY